MTFKDQIIQTLGENYTESDDLLIEQLENYYKIYKAAWKNLNKEGYRISVSAKYSPTGFYRNSSLDVVTECSKNIRAILETLGLTKKGSKLKIETSEASKKTLLDDIKSTYKA